jgi:hypothetical protein
MMGLAEETVANTFNVAGGQAPRQSAKWSLIYAALAPSI